MYSRARGGWCYLKATGGGAGLRNRASMTHYYKQGCP